ncbi:MAG: hypothetical protein MRJ93_11105 [Nitrososphaeraceae archaeon]|nr:hypothetical protein [Nitrososphaeraceae archaeon]
MESIAINITLAELWRKYNLNPIMYYNWKQKLIGVRMVLSGSSKDKINKDLETENESLKSITVEQTMAIDAFKKTLETGRKV